MNEDIYENYNADRYIHYRLVPTGDYNIVPAKRNGKVISTRRPILEKREISFEEIKELNLDNYGQDVRTCAEDFSFIHNYFFDYWGSIIGTDAVVTYLHLKRYCYGNRDFCFPDMEIIQAKMKKGSRNTVIKAMDTLEEFGFITKILRKDKLNKNADSSPFFKIRRYIPLLSEELLQLLPEKLRKEHDKFVAKTNGIVLEEHTHAQEIINQLLEKARSFNSNKAPNKEDDLKRQGKLYEYAISKMTGTQHENWLRILKALSTKISKPSLDTWFSQTILLLDVSSSHLTVISPNYYYRDWIEERYKDILSSIISDQYEEISRADLKIECILLDEYIKSRLEKNTPKIDMNEENIS